MIDPADLPSAPDALEFVRLALRGDLTILSLLDHLPIYKTGADWTPWRACLAAIYGLPMTDTERAYYTAASGRTIPPKEKAREVWIPAGRRARKSALAALIAVWEGALRSHKHALAPGERGRVLIMSESLARATVVFNYAKTLLTQTQLKCLLGGTPNTEKIPLWNNIDIEIAPARRVAAIARTTVCAIFDEIAFFPTDEEYANPDEVILQAIRPSMATVDKPLILGVSSPYARRGLLWKNYSEHFGREDSPTLVWQAASDIMNPHPGVIAEMRSEYEKDPISASAEFGAQFRADIEQYLDLEMLAACTTPRGELPVPRDAKGNTLFPERRYFAYVDPAGGGSDQFALAIAHYDSGASRGVLDLIRAWSKPLSTDAIVARCADILRDYSITRVTGDKYAGDWPKDAFATHGISYVKADLNRSEMYLEFIPLVRSRVIDLPDRLPVEGAGDLAHKMRMQFTALDRTTTALSKERVDHPRGKHDDVCQVVAGAMVYCVPRMRRVREEIPPEEDPLWPMKRARALMFDFSRYTSPKPSMNPYGIFHGGRKH